MAKTSIEWTGASWNPVTGCSKVSDGCSNCYAEKISHRFKLTEKPWSAANAQYNVQCHEDRLEQPLHMKKPQRIFVNSMSDLFHPNVPFEFIDKVFAIMAIAENHTFQILTKRPERMYKYFLSDARWESVLYEANQFRPTFDLADWPLPNVWLGVSVENQKVANERIPLLFQIPAAKRFLSCEPLLEQVDLGLNCKTECYCPKCKAIVHRSQYSCLKCGYQMDKLKQPWGKKPAIDWVIVGGESGSGARPMHPDWVRLIRDQCQGVGVPFFFKQWGEWAPYVDEEKYTHGSGESPKNMQHYVSIDGDLNACWIYDEDGSWQNWTGEPGNTAHIVNRWGKKRSGRILDGHTWDEIPI